MLNPLTHRRILKKGRPGRATIVAIGALDRGSTSFNLPMTLQVFVEGMTPYEIEDQWMVKAKDTIGLSGSIPVKVDPGEPQKVAIDWEVLRAEVETGDDARRDALAAMGPVPAGGLSGMTQGAPDAAAAASQQQAADAASSFDLRGDPQLRAKLEAVLGYELVPGSTVQVAAGNPMLQMQVMQTIQEHMAAKAAGAAAGAGAPPASAADPPGADDVVSQLERLSALRASGALTQAEFEAQKARVLSGG